MKEQNESSGMRPDTLSGWPPRPSVHANLCESLQRRQIPRTEEEVLLALDMTRYDPVKAEAMMRTGLWSVATGETSGPMYIAWKPLKKKREAAQ